MLNTNRFPRPVDQSDAAVLLRQSRFAMLYILDEEPSKAVSILTKALNGFEGPANAKSFPLSALAWAQVDAGDSTAANRSLDKAFLANSGRESYELLPVIAEAMRVQGRGADGEKLLVQNIDDPQSPAFAKPALLLGLARLQNARGEYSKAESSLRQIDEKAGFAPNRLQQSTELNYALSKQGKNERFVAALFNNFRDSKSTNQELLSMIDKANSHKIDGLAIKDLYSIAMRLPNSDVDPKTSIVIEKTIAAGRSQGLSDQNLTDLQCRLAYMYGCETDYSRAIKAQTDLAEKFESAKNPAAFSAWLDVARFQVNNKHYQQGTEAVLRALNAAGGSNFPNHPGNVRSDLLLEPLAEAKQFDSVERILLEDIKNQKSAMAAGKGYPLLRMALLADYYIQWGQFAKAEPLINEVLTGVAQSKSICDSSSREPDSELSVLLWAGNSYCKAQRGADAVKLASRILDLQKQFLGIKNPQLVGTISLLGTAYSTEKNYKDAELAFKRDLDLESWNYGAQSRSTCEVRAAYANVLRLQGKVDDAERVAAIYPKELQRPSDEGLYDSGARIGRFGPNQNADAAEEPLKQRLKDSSEIVGEGNQATFDALNALVKYYEGRNKFADAEIYLKRKLQALDEIEGKCTKRRAVCMVECAQLKLLQGDRDGAREWLKKG